jgi:hypothetical protein
MVVMLRHSSILLNFLFSYPRIPLHKIHCALSSHDLISFSFHDAKMVLWTSGPHERSLLVALDMLLLP